MPFAQVRKAVDGYRHKKFPPQTSAAPRWPATATRVAAPKSAPRYTSTDRRDSTCQDMDAVAAPIAATVAATPIHLCHASAGVASTNGADASTQPAITVRPLESAPARRLATATVRQLWRPVQIASSSQPAAASTNPIGK